MKTNSNDLIEMITVRLNTCGDLKILNQILRELEGGFTHPGGGSGTAGIYRNGQVDSDWSICLRYPSGEKVEKSPLAINLAEILRPAGLVNHSVWLPCDESHLSGSTKNRENQTNITTTNK